MDELEQLILAEGDVALNPAIPTSTLVLPGDRLQLFLSAGCQHANEASRSLLIAIEIVESMSEGQDEGVAGSNPATPTIPCRARFPDPPQLADGISLTRLRRLRIEAAWLALSPALGALRPSNG
jgi:hypothetical protein